jgi:hypothetical protein
MYMHGVHAMTHIQSQLLVYEHDVSHLASFAVDYIWQEWQTYWLDRLLSKQFKEVLDSGTGAFSSAAMAMVGVHW